MCCPCDSAELRLVGTHFSCTACGSTFPIQYGTPVLIDPSTSLFAGVTGLEWDPCSHNHGRFKWATTALKQLRPATSTNLTAKANYKELARLALTQSPSPLVLIVGVGELGKGLKDLLGDSRFSFVESDVYFGHRVNVIADGHKLPFKDNSFDAVICQAVLEHVSDPVRCVNEIWRVLSPNGIIYSEVPFMQQVHGGAYDFTRFSMVGCRRLFRKFKKESAGMVAGPGTALAWSIEYFVRSFSNSKAWHFAARNALPFATFWIKYFDYIFQHIHAAEDGASCCFFLGRKRHRST